MDRVDIAVVGRGAVGQAAALALAAPGRRVALVGPPPSPAVSASAAASAVPAPPASGPGAPDLPDAATARPSPAPGWDPRVFALSPASQRLLVALGAWQGIAADRIAPVYDMRLLNEAGVHQPEVHLDAYRGQVDALAWIVENRELVRGLDAALDRSPVETFDATVATVHLPSNAAAPAEVVLEFDDGRRLATRLLVGADGLQSRIREAAGIAARIVDHGQTAIVANFESERPGRDIAWQWFGPHGILAWLPLPPPRGSAADGSFPARGRWSLVWSVPDDRLEAARVRPLVESIDGITGQRFGRLRQISPTRSFPLRSVLATTVIAPGVALVGDAAHAIHPMAGQGMNLGFGDVAALAAVVGSCPALGSAPDREAPGSRPVLRRYERSRAEAVLAMQLGLSALERLFAPPPDAVSPPLAGLRDTGWRFVARSPWLRRRLIRHAVS